MFFSCCKYNNHDVNNIKDVIARVYCPGNKRSGLEQSLEKWADQIGLESISSHDVREGLLVLYAIEWLVNETQTVTEEQLVLLSENQQYTRLYPLVTDGIDESSARAEMPFKVNVSFSDSKDKVQNNPVFMYTNKGAVNKEDPETLNSQLNKMSGKILAFEGDLNCLLLDNVDSNEAFKYVSSLLNWCYKSYTLDDGKFLVVKLPKQTLMCLATISYDVARYLNENNAVWMITESQLTFRATEEVAHHRFYGIKPMFSSNKEKVAYFDTSNYMVSDINPIEPLIPQLEKLPKTLCFPTVVAKWGNRTKLDWIVKELGKKGINVTLQYAGYELPKPFIVDAEEFNRLRTEDAFTIEIDWNDETQVASLKTAIAAIFDEDKQLPEADRNMQATYKPDSDISEFENLVNSII